MQSGVVDLSVFKVNTVFGQTGLIRGLYAPNMFAFRVVQQPIGNYLYISSLEDVVTQMQSAERYGVTGLIAHNYLAGRYFIKMRTGQEIQVILANGKYIVYRVTTIEFYQRIVPDCSTSDLIDLSNGNRMNYADVFDRFYTGEHRLTLQTCLSMNGLQNYGLVFVTSEIVR